jgi:hypothetical protein
MSRRAAIITQADVARVVRAAKQAGAATVEVRRDGTIVILLSAPPIAPDLDADAFEKWERENESAKAARRRDRV